MAIEDYTWPHVQTMLDAFVARSLSQAVVKHMKGSSGRIINIGSEVLNDGALQFSAYVAAKGGQNGPNRSPAKELAPWNITVNMVHPDGFLWSDMLMCPRVEGGVSVVDTHGSSVRLQM